MSSDLQNCYLDIFAITQIEQYQVQVLDDRVRISIRGRKEGGTSTAGISMSVVEARLLAKTILHECDAQDITTNGETNDRQRKDKRYKN